MSMESTRTSVTVNVDSSVTTVKRLSISIDSILLKGMFYGSSESLPLSLSPSLLTLPLPDKTSNYASTTTVPRKPTTKFATKTAIYSLVIMTEEIVLLISHPIPSVRWPITVNEWLITDDVMR